MGFIIEFNWALKLKPKQGLNEDSLETGKVYNFSKEKHRLYPIGVPIDLVNERWECLGKIIITELLNNTEGCKGKYRILRLYSSQEKTIFTSNWKETIDFTVKKIQESKS